MLACKKQRKNTNKIVRMLRVGIENLIHILMIKKICRILNLKIQLLKNKDVV